MEIDVPPSSMSSRQVKHNIHALHGAPGKLLVAQIPFNEFNSASIKVSLDVLHPPTTQIVHDANSGSATFEQCVDKVRANE